MAKLSERTMLVQFSKSSWAGRKQDKAVGHEVTSSKKADADVVSVWKRLAPPEALKPITAAGNKIYGYFKSHTLPYTVGVGILAAEDFFTFSEGLRKVAREAGYDKKVDELLTKYDEIVADAPRRMGEMYNPAEIPTREALRAKFSWSINFLPFPDLSTPTAFEKIVGGSVDDANKAIAEGVEAKMKEAMSGLWDRLYGAVKHMADTLGNEKGRIHETLISNMKELCDVLTKLNIADDANLAALTSIVRKGLAESSADELRDNKYQRKATALVANTIADKIEALRASVGVAAPVVAEVPADDNDDDEDINEDDAAIAAKVAALL